MNETNIFLHKACSEQNVLGENYTRSFFSLEIHRRAYINLYSFERSLFTDVITVEFNNTCLGKEGECLRKRILRSPVQSTLKPI